MQHILIIGAGASGLMAAATLLEKKNSVTILEARSRVGGRIHTLSSEFSLPVDAGAEFIHGDQPVTMSLLQKSRVKLSLLSGNHYSFKKGQWQAGDSLNHQWESFMHSLQKLEDDTDMASFLTKHFKADEELRQQVKDFAEGFDLADINKASAIALREEWKKSNDDDQYHIDGGYVNLIRLLEEKVKLNGGSIISSSVVTEIQWSKEKVSVLTTTNNVIETIKADKVIITVPLGVLQKGLINFVPALPQHQIAFDSMGFGGVIKFLFEFKRAFWEDHSKKYLQDVAFIFSDAAVPTWWSQHPNKVPLLTGWLGGPSANEITNDANLLFEMGIESLHYIFDCPVEYIKDQLKQWKIINWVNDPYTFGAYAYTTLGTAEALKLILQPVSNKLYFAGEAMYSGDAMGTVEAALTSGIQVANQVIG